MIPVSRISVSVDCSSNVGAFLWIGRCFSTVGAGWLSIGSPRTLKIRPRVFSPTGTVMGAPVATASIPLTRPSVEPMAIQRTVSSPRCWDTSATSFLPSFMVMLIASLISGKCPWLNLISNTALIICVILPVFCSAILFLLLFLHRLQLPESLPKAVLGYGFLAFTVTAFISTRLS